MAYLFIRSVNSEFQSRDDGAEYDSPEAALELGLRGAVSIASEEMERGARAVAVEIIVERADNSQVMRSILALSISTMMLTENAPAKINSDLACW